MSWFRFSSGRAGRPTLTRPSRAGLFLAGVLAWAGLVERTPAGPLPPDPVEGLRVLLKQEPLRDPEALRQRKDELAKKAEAVRSLADLSRALLLPDWRTDVPGSVLATGESQIQDALARRFQDGARAVLEKGTSQEKSAAAHLVGETAAAARGLATLGPRTTYLRRTIAALVPDLVRLTRDRSARVREAAATALGKVEPEPAPEEPAVPPAGNGAPEVPPAQPAAPGQSGRLGQVVGALDALLDDPRVGPRRAAARALRSLVAVGIQQERKSRGPRLDNLSMRRKLLATGARIIGPAARGLDRSQPLDVRRASADACREVTTALMDLVPDPVEATGFVAPSRLLGPADRRRLEEERGFLESETRDFQPLLLAFQHSVERLAAASRDPDPAVRRQVRQAIEELAAVRQRLVRQEHALPHVESRPGEAPGGEQGFRGARETLQATLKQTVAALVAGLKDTDARGRLAAIDALETLDHEATDAVPALVESLGDRDLFVRWAAARTLGRLAPARPDLVVPAVRPLLGANDLDLRVVAANTLAHYGPAAAAAVPDLARTARTGDPDIRIASMKALESIGTAAEPALPALLEDLTYHNPQVRATAARTLARFGTAAAFAKPALTRALNDSDADVRKAASEALLKADNK